jgi:hypothetical protein
MSRIFSSSYTNLDSSMSMVGLLYLTVIFQKNDTASYLLFLRGTGTEIIAIERVALAEMFNIEFGNHTVQTLLNHPCTDSFRIVVKIGAPNVFTFFFFFSWTRRRFLSHFYPSCIFVEQFSRYTRIQYVRYRTYSLLISPPTI